jgi:hypothetical protein
MSRLRAMIVLTLATSIARPAIGSGQVVIPVMVGRWEGDAQIVVDWTRQRTLRVNIEIFANDSVTGSVGDARLVNGRFLKSPGSLPGALRWKTDYTIVVPSAAVLSASSRAHQQAERPPAHTRSRRDRNLDDAILLAGEQLIRLFDSVEREMMSHERPKIQALGLEHAHQATHPLFATRTQRRDDPVITKPCRKRVEG